MTKLHRATGVQPESPIGLAASGRDEDLLLFTPATRGWDTAGSWSLNCHGFDAELGSSGEDVNGTWLDEDLTPYPNIYLSTVGSSSVSGVSGAYEDILIFHPASLDSATSGTFGPGFFLNGSAPGLGAYDIDGFDIQR
jgi:hypothetical protein